MRVVHPGLDPQWLSEWSKQSKFNTTSIQNNDLRNLESLDYYAIHGISNQKRQYSVDPVLPPARNWESFLPSNLKMYGIYRALELQKEGASSLRWDVSAAIRSFTSIYTGEMISIYGHFLFSQRFPGRTCQMMDMKMVPYTALGLVVGARDQALKLGKLQANAYRRGYYLTKPYYPIFNFILRILTDYLGDPPLDLEGEPASEPIFNALFEMWREPDLTALAEVCLAGCDFHTHRCRMGKRDQFQEFDNGSWMRIPIEILLLFKLRRLIGLDNPHLDHPLMTTAFGMLPPEVEFQPDDLIARVRARMQQDDYDEDAIFALGTGD